MTAASWLAQQQAGRQGNNPVLFQGCCSTHGSELGCFLSCTFPSIFQLGSQQSTANQLACQLSLIMQNDPDPLVRRLEGALALAIISVFPSEQKADAAVSSLRLVPQPLRDIAAAPATHLQSCSGTALARAGRF
jgi:hypothetical protein